MTPEFDLLVTFKITYDIESYKLAANEFCISLDDYCIRYHGKWIKIFTR